MPAVFCSQCLTVREGNTLEACAECAVAMQPALDAQGAMSAAYLLARGECCGNGCRNCPYSKSASRAVNCERCGTPFTCGGDSCWCAVMKLNETIQKQLATTYGDCLCQTCLQHLAAATEGDDRGRPAPPDRLDEAAASGDIRKPRR